jgi:hypothetical protein
MLPFVHLSPVSSEELSPRSSGETSRWLITMLFGNVSDVPRFPLSCPKDTVALPSLICIARLVLSKE